VASGEAIVAEAAKRKLNADFFPLNTPLDMMEETLKEVISKLFNQE
jgi:hypothetical protein